MTSGWTPYASLDAEIGRARRRSGLVNGIPDARSSGPVVTVAGPEHCSNVPQQQAPQLRMEVGVRSQDIQQTAIYSLTVASERIKLDHQIRRRAVESSAAERQRQQIVLPVAGRRCPGRANLTV
jgi:hypothetical protein